MRAFFLNPIESSLLKFVCLFLTLVLEFFLNVYLLFRDRETQSLSRGGVERGGDIESEAGPRLQAVSTEPDTGLELMNCETMT